MAVSKNVLSVLPKRKGARGPLVGRAEPCNHKQMTEIPGSASSSCVTPVHSPLRASVPLPVRGIWLERKQTQAGLS